MYPRSAPQGIRFRHPPYQLPDLPVCCRSTTMVPGKPGPVQGEPLPAPTKHGFGLDDYECLLPVGPKSGQEKPEQSICSLEFGAPVLTVKDGQLLSKRKVLKSQLRTQPEGGRNQTEQLQNRRQHHGQRVSDLMVRKVNPMNEAGVFAMDRMMLEAAAPLFPPPVPPSSAGRRH